MRRVVKDIIVNHPLELLEVTFAIKPLKLLYYYCANYVRPSFLPPTILFVISIVYTIFLLKSSKKNDLVICAGSLCLFIGSSIVVPIFIYPGVHTLSDFSLLLTTFFLGVVILICNWVVGRLDLVSRYRILRLRGISDSG